MLKFPEMEIKFEGGNLQSEIYRDFNLLSSRCQESKSQSKKWRFMIHDLDSPKKSKNPYTIIL